jgi:FAD/FMN-containing dehydrogenase
MPEACRSPSSIWLTRFTGLCWPYNSLGCNACRLRIAVQATGHGFVWAADGALLINVSRLNSVQVDPVSQTVKVQPGATWAHVLEAAHEFGLTGLVGDTRSVGFGWLARKYGLGCDALLEVQVVTMSGVLRTVNAELEPELFWGLRGGAGGGLAEIWPEPPSQLVPVGAPSRCK